MKLIRRILATALTLALLLELLPVPAAAVMEAQTVAVVPTEKPTTLQTGSGETVKIDDEWEAKYPYGAFVFAASSLTSQSTTLAPDCANFCPQRSPMPEAPPLHIAT